MNHRFLPSQGFFRAILLGVWLACGSSARAQTLTSFADSAVPFSRDPGVKVIGLETSDTQLLLFTTKYYYASPLGTTPAFTAVADFSGLIPLYGSSFAKKNPTLPGWYYFTAQAGPNFRLYEYRVSPPGATFTTLAGFAAFPTGLAADSVSGTVFLSRDPSMGAGISKVSPSSGTSLLTFGNSGLGTLNTPGALAFGPDGRLYVLDTGDNRIVSFDPDGVFQQAFPLAGTAAPSALAIDARGFLYTANGNGGGDIYNTATGAHVGDLASGTSFPDAEGGKASLAVDGSNHLYLYDAPTGVHVFDVSAVPEPGAYAAAAGIGLLIFVLWRWFSRNVVRNEEPHSNHCKQRAS